jgi:hypothetical protein
MQAHEYLAADASADIVENIREQIVTDIFFIDVLTELLNTPLLIIDYIAQRCRYGQRFTVQSEINALGCYLSEAMYFEDKVDNIIIDSDMGRDVDMAMTVRRLLGIPGQGIPQGLLTKLNRDDPYSSFVQQLSSPHRNEELQLGMSLLHYPEERVLKQFNVVTEQIRSRCTANRPTHSVSVEFSGTGGFSLVSTLEAVTAKATLSAVDTIRRNQKKRGGEWFTIVFNSRSLRILDIEHCGSKILKNVPTESTFS